MIDFIFYSFLAACLEMAFQEYMDRNMIFEWYFTFISKLYSRGGLLKKISMVMGKCIFCHGFWLSVAIYIWHYKSFNIVNMLLFAGLNWFFIKMIIGIKNKLY
jgi:hypothetical protein